MANSMQTMTHAATLSPLQNLRLALIPAVILVLFLFYIDEGWYSFRWMLDWGNWIVFVIYMMLLTPVFWLMTHFLFPGQTGAKKVLLVSLTGLPVMLLLAYLLFMK